MTDQLVCFKCTWTPAVTAQTGYRHQRISPHQGVITRKGYRWHWKSLQNRWAWETSRVRVLYGVTLLIRRDLAKRTEVLFVLVVQQWEELVFNPWSRPGGLAASYSCTRAVLKSIPPPSLCTDPSSPQEAYVFFELLVWGESLRRRVLMSVIWASHLVSS